MACSRCQKSFCSQPADSIVGPLSMLMFRLAVVITDDYGQPGNLHACLQMRDHFMRACITGKPIQLKAICQESLLLQLQLQLRASLASQLPFVRKAHALLLLTASFPIPHHCKILCSKHPKFNDQSH